MILFILFGNPVTISVNTVVHVQIIILYLNSYKSGCNITALNVYIHFKYIYEVVCFILFFGSAKV